MCNIHTFLCLFVYSPYKNTREILRSNSRIRFQNIEDQFIDYNFQNSESLNLDSGNNDDVDAKRETKMMLSPRRTRSFHMHSVHLFTVLPSCFLYSSAKSRFTFTTFVELQMLLRYCLRRQK